MLEYPALNKEFKKEIDFSVLTSEMIEYIKRAYAVGYALGKKKGEKEEYSFLYQTGCLTVQRMPN